LNYPPLPDWTPMSKAAFDEYLTTIEDGTYGEKRMAEMLDELITAGQDWADETFVGILRGCYGTNVRKVALQAVENGFRQNGAIYSFTRFCVHHKKLELLEAVADLGLPEERAQTDEFYGNASTPSGVWLDILANVGGSGPVTSFARQVDAFSGSAFAPVLADILVKHDPEHYDIEVLKGSHGYAVIIDALMRSRIGMSTDASVSDAASERSRRRRAEL
jgi:hypothetical protein